MRVKQIEFKQFRQFRHFTLALDPQLTLLTAANGGGKSTILDGIAYLLTPYIQQITGRGTLNLKPHDLRVIPGGHTPPYLQLSIDTNSGLTWDHTLRRVSKAGKTKTKLKSHGLKSLRTYLENRLVDTSRSLSICAYFGQTAATSKRVKTKLRQHDLRLLALQGSMDVSMDAPWPLKQYVQQMSPTQKAWLDAAIHRVLPHLSHLRFDKHGAWILDCHQSPESTTPLRFKQLCESDRFLLTLVSHLSTRLMLANPNRPQPLTGGKGVILIDGIERYLHPRQQQLILPLLMNLFPKLQWIITTHSPQVITSIPPHHLRMIHGEGAHPSVEQASFTEGAEAQQVLKEVLETNPRPEHLPIVQKLRRYQAMVAQGSWDRPEALGLRQSLDQWGAEHEPELKRLDMDIRLKELDRPQ
ncbi:AAA family ATPase [Magnetococcus sp. PR-3]|uniref:AAA family ATPase n=1 Tax=Magnetococcus sp. PR-3 TaxID=3120355 RepID=UPI002FCE2C2B